MTDIVRVLTDAGIARFAAYLASIRTGETGPVPLELLADPVTSASLEANIEVERMASGKPFVDRYEFGIYLREQLKKIDHRSISRNYGLWTWLALYYFDQLCAVEVDGARKPRADEAYILAREFKYDSYYRHLVRTAWLAASEHNDFSRVLLVPAGKPGATPLGQRGEIIEQLAGRQSIFGSSTIIEGAYRLYFDSEKGRPKRGAGGSGAGSPRRLALVVQQLDLTYDLRASTAQQFLGLLPKEFDRWHSNEETPSARA